MPLKSSYSDGFLKKSNSSFWMAEPESKSKSKFLFWMAEPGHPRAVGVLHDRHPLAGTPATSAKKLKCLDIFVLEFCFSCVFYLMMARTIVACFLLFFSLPNPS
jgi:hypothetical protein